MRRSVIGRVVLVAACTWSAWTGPAAAAGECDAQARALGDRLERIAVAGRGDADAVERLEAELRSAIAAEPACAEAFRKLGPSGRTPAAAGGEPEPFAGPIGWLWNTVFYRVFQGNAVMMAIFGWALLLAPVIVVLSLVAVLRGTSGALRRPTALGPAD